MNKIRAVDVVARFLEFRFMPTGVDYPEQKVIPLF